MTYKFLSLLNFLLTSPPAHRSGATISNPKEVIMASRINSASGDLPPVAPSRSYFASFKDKCASLGDAIVDRSNNAVDWTAVRVRPSIARQVEKLSSQSWDSKLMKVLKVAGAFFACAILLVPIALCKAWNSCCSTRFERFRSSTVRPPGGSGTSTSFTGETITVRPGPQNA